MEYIKTYFILYKSNTRVIYFSYMLNRTFILTGCCEVSGCIQYDMISDGNNGVTNGIIVFSNE